MPLITYIIIDLNDVSINLLPAVYFSYTAIIAISLKRATCLPILSRVSKYLLTCLRCSRQSCTYSFLAYVMLAYNWKIVIITTISRLRRHGSHALIRRPELNRSAFYSQFPLTFFFIIYTYIYIYTQCVYVCGYIHTYIYT